MHEWMGAEFLVLGTLVADLGASFSPVWSTNVRRVELLDLVHDRVQEVWSLKWVVNRRVEVDDSMHETG